MLISVKLLYVNVIYLSQFIQPINERNIAEQKHLFFCSLANKNGVLWEF